MTRYELDKNAANLARGQDKRPNDCKTKKPVPRGGVEVAREVREAEVAREVRETQEVPEAEAEKAQEVPTPVDSRIASKFDEFPDENDENDVPP